MKKSRSSGILYTESTENNIDPSKEDIEEQARRIGIDIDKEPHLISLAKDCLTANLPAPWKPCFDDFKNAWYYYNEKTLKSQWEHPLDILYREKVIQVRSDLAMNRIQNFNASSMKPPKSLPPLKKPVGGLNPLNHSSGLGKLGPLGSHSQGSPFGSNAFVPPTIRSLDDTISKGFQESTYLEKLGSLGGSANRLKPLKQLSQSNSDNLRTASSTPNTAVIERTSNKSLKGKESLPVQKQELQSSTKRASHGLTLTGNGANFIKGAPSLGNSTKSESIEDGPSNSEEKTSKSGPSSLASGKPLKSIMVNSFCRSQFDQESTIDRPVHWDLNLKNLTEEEETIWKQLELGETRKTNVKFNLDENTELRFELSSNENEGVESGDQETLSGSNDTKDEETEEDEELDEDMNQGFQPPLKQVMDYKNLVSKLSAEKIPIDNGKKNVLRVASEPMNAVNSKATNSSSNTQFKNSETKLSSNSKELVSTIESTKTSLRHEMEEELKKFQLELEKEREERKSQMKQQIEESLKQISLEHETTIHTTKSDFEKQKNIDLDKAKLEIENILKAEMNKIKAEFQVKIQTKRGEMIDEHNKSINDLSAELKQAEDAKRDLILEVKRSEASLKLQADLNVTKEDIRKEHQIEIQQLQDNHLATIEKMKLEFGVEKETIRNTHKTEIDEMVRTFEAQKEDTLKKLQSDKDEAIDKIETEHEERTTALGLQLSDLMEKIERIKEKLEVESTNSSLPAPVSRRNSSQTLGSKQSELEKKDKEEEDFKSKYHSLEEKYSSLKSELQNVVANEKSKNGMYLNPENISKSKSEPIHVYHGAGEKSTVGLEIRSNKSANSLGNYDSANASDSESSFCQSSSEVPRNTERTVSEEPDIKLSVDVMNSGTDSRLTKALQSLEILKTQILELRADQEKNAQRHNQISPQRLQRSHRHGHLYNSESSRSIKSKLSATKNASDIVLNKPSASMLPSKTSVGKELPNRDVVEEAKDFIRSQKHRIKRPGLSFGTPIATTLGIQQRLALQQQKKGLSSTISHSPPLQESMKVLPSFLSTDHREMLSETESSGVGSWKDLRTVEKDKVSADISQICSSLAKLDEQMKEMWSVVRNPGNKYQQSGNMHHNTITANAFINNHARNSARNSALATAGINSLGTTPGDVRFWDTPNLNLLTTQSALTASASDMALHYSLSPYLSNTRPIPFRSSDMEINQSGGRMMPTVLSRSLGEQLAALQSVKDRVSVGFPRNLVPDTMEDKTKDLREWLEKF